MTHTYKRIVIREHERIVRSDQDSADPGDYQRLHSRLYDQLKRFDQRERTEQEQVFAWGDNRARAQQWVGVIQVPGLQVEILPKVDNPESSEESQEEHEARHNLLYMLAIAGDVPVRDRDVAHLANRKAPLSELLIAIFAYRLREELLRGAEHAYLQREENLRRFKGKLIIPAQILHNSARRERFFCRFDEFSKDTAMNRIFRFACATLLTWTHTPSTQDKLRHCLLLLDGVEYVSIHDELFEQIPITRQNERFADVLHFCRLILQGHSPTTNRGKQRSFSLLFDMNQVFEAFVAAFMRKWVMPLPGFPQHRLYPQAKRRQRHLITRNDKGVHKGVLSLRPDLLIEAPESPEDDRKLVLDTKWKRLSGSGGRGGAGTADIYQLYAYTQRYGCQRSILLYPHVARAECQDFDIAGCSDKPTGQQILVRYVHLHRNLRKNRESLAKELMKIITQALAA